MSAKWYQNKLLITPALLGIFLGLGFVAATANRPSSHDKTERTSFASSDNPGDRSLESSPEVATTSNKFNFPKASCGDKPTGANDNWYPVFVDGGDLDTIRKQFCADAAAAVRKDTKVATVQLASFTNPERASEFAKAVGGDVGEPTLAQADSSSESNNRETPANQSPSQENTTRRPTASIQTQASDCPMSYTQVREVLLDATSRNYFSVDDIAYGEKAIGLVQQVYRNPNCQNLQPQIRQGFKLAWNSHLNKKYQRLIQIAQTSKSSVTAGTAAYCDRSNFAGEFTCSLNQIIDETGQSAALKKVSQDYQKDRQAIESFF
jgi:hypothetical protein